MKLDGRDMKELNVHYLRSQIGYVGQEPALFATTIENNIRYGKADATMEEIEEAAKRANAYDFISGFSDGFQTQVGDKGTQLSGGKNILEIKFCIVYSPSNSFQTNTVYSRSKTKDCHRKGLSWQPQHLTSGYVVNTLCVCLSVYIYNIYIFMFLESSLISVNYFSI